MHSSQSTIVTGTNVIDSNKWILLKHSSIPACPALWQVTESPDECEWSEIPLEDVSCNHSKLSLCSLEYKQTTKYKYPTQLRWQKITICHQITARPNFGSNTHTHTPNKTIICKNTITDKQSQKQYNFLIATVQQRTSTMQQLTYHLN